MTVSEKIKLLLGRRKMTITALAWKMGISRQYLTKKLKENAFSVDDLQQIAKHLNCGLEITFTDKGERL